MRAQALFSVLSRKLKDNEIIFVDSLALTDIKTKQAVRVMENLAKATGFKSLANSKKKRVLIAIYGRSEKTEKSFRNLPQLELVFLKNLNPLDVLNYQYLVIENPKESIEFLESRG
ncbi:MAG: 50S ribosomal protein L4 [Candidatus Nomurabacteria bacterium GW2011_GWA1_40_8]|nr:MAG: 50S ribosomal protein L4 [Candidatus Nomurabacteria bacterium GW2011_GWA1_40_8]